MANEITVMVNLVARKGGAICNPGGQTKSLAMAGDNMLNGTQLVGTSAELVSFGEIAGAPAAVMLKNLDATNFILYGPSNPPAEFKLLAGMVALVSPSAANLYVKADTAACRLLVAAVEA